MSVDRPSDQSEYKEEERPSVAMQPVIEGALVKDPSNDISPLDAEDDSVACNLYTVNSTFENIT